MLEIRDLTCGYDSKFLLQNINIKVDKGEIIAIIGPNGSGKTTLIRAVSRVFKPHEGAIQIEGQNIWEMGFKYLAKKMAVVSQVFEAGVMTVEEFVLLGRIPYYEGFQFLETKKDIEIAKMCMEVTDTIRFKDRFMGDLSGGERQLVVIARAIAQEPVLLLLDEPTTHLDIFYQAKILDLIKRLNKESGLTVVMVLHDLNLASEYCQRVILINRGVIYKTGRPDEVLSKETIKEVYKTEVFIGENPISFKPYVFMSSLER